MPAPDGYGQAFAITPSDTTTFERTKAILIGSGVDTSITVTMDDGADAAFGDAVLPVDTIIPIAVVAVKATGTSAGDIWGFR